MKKTKQKRAKKVQMIEICRSFSYKLNVGNFESRDFFMSQKGECKPADAEKVSEAMHEFCKKMVIRDVNKFLAIKEPLPETSPTQSSIGSPANFIVAPKRNMSAFYEKKDNKQNIRENVMIDEATDDASSHN